MVLEKIKQPNDIKRVSYEELPQLAREIREFLIQKISVSGGHLASNLGVVELTMALHLAFSLPKDKIIFDVGHQSYTHKLLTGRKEGFDCLRTFGGMSGFPKRKESKCDVFDTGHSSTSISAGLGMVMARDIKEENFSVISVIGDGSLTGGMAYEALNHAGEIKTNFIIVMNDNHMSISKNVGGLSKSLNEFRTAPGYRELKSNVERVLTQIPFCGNTLVKHIRKAKSGLKQMLIPGMFFEEMGVTYLGPVNGHDIKEMIKVFHEARQIEGAVLVHVLTKKGKGYRIAEQNPAHFHGAEPFDVTTGKPLFPKKKETWTDIFSKSMITLGKERTNVVAITAAMADGTGLKEFQKQFPGRFFDVGIAEAHGVTFAAGLASQGIRPVVAIYSSFLQRAYDQILHDVCIQNLPVLFAIDRAGLVGSDGETHQGIFDISFLRTIPNMNMMAPKNKEELELMMRFALDFQGPMAIRYPRGTASTCLEEYLEPIVLGKSEVIYEEEEIALFAYGSMVETAEKVRRRLKQSGYLCTLINARFAVPLDEKKILELNEDHKLLVTLEENVLAGGLGEQVVTLVKEAELPLAVMPIGLQNEYVEHGNVEILKKETGIDEESIFKKIIACYAGL